MTPFATIALRAEDRRLPTSGNEVRVDLFIEPTQFVPLALTQPGPVHSTHETSQRMREPYLRFRLAVHGQRKARNGRRYANGGTGRVDKTAWRTIGWRPVAGIGEGNVLSFPELRLSGPQVTELRVRADYFLETGLVMGSKEAP